MRPLVVDLFAGGGGASEGIQRALGRAPDIAVNHDREAVAMHEANHLATRHLCGSVWEYSPARITGGSPVDLLWASPDCTHFSRAKGGKPRSSRRRALAWVVVRWAREVRPRVIALENVPELLTWGPLGPDGTPCPRRSGRTWRTWVRALEAEGYVVEHRQLRACDYGAPTSRRRLFVVARRDGEPVSWPEPTRGPGLAPFRAAAECIEWGLPAPSIFGRARPPVPTTLARVARGLRRFVLEARDPFVVRLVDGQVVAPTLVQRGYGEREGQAPRVLDIREPLGTVVAGGVKHAVVFAFLAKHYGGNETPGSSLRDPMGTVTTRDHHALVTASTVGDHEADVLDLLERFRAPDSGSLRLPLGVARAPGRVVVDGVEHVIRDVGMRMLTPRELFRAQGFPDDYVIDPVVDGSPLGVTAQVRMCGNSVPPALVAAVVGANVPRRRLVAA